MSFMERAVELARLGEGFVNPNPLVGAVIVKDGKIIGEGYHAKYGDLHAERNALKKCTESPVGADMYVTLEPCCHTGKQPPCTEAVIESGIKRVFIGSYDPNPEVAGKGIEILRNAGIEVIEAYKKDICDKLNPIFFKYITTGLPYVILKTAVTADGKIAAYTGDSKWITNEKSRENVHKTRKNVSAIMTGIGTVLNDNPMLNCRIENPKNPIRVVCDSNLRIPLESQIVKTAKGIPTVVAAAAKDINKEKALNEQGVKVIYTKSENGKVSLADLMKRLGEMKIDSVMIEAGAALNGAALEAGIIDCLQLYIAPKLIGGNITAIGGTGIAKMSDAIKLSEPRIQFFDSDIMLEYDVIKENK